MHYFVASLLELIPNIALVETRATRTGFICDLVAPFPITSDYIKMAEERAREKIKKGAQFHVNEMIPANAADFLRARKQVLRSKQIDREEQFVTVVFNETYANFQVGSEGELGSFSVENEGVVDTVQFHGKPVGVTRLRGMKKEFRQKLKESKDHQKVTGYFKFEKDHIVWLERGLKVRQQLVDQICALLDGEYQRVHRPFAEVAPSKREFDVIEVPGDEHGEFGLKDRFSHLLVRVGIYDRNSLLLLKEKLCKVFALTYEDDLGLQWEIVESEEGLLKIWVDRLFAMILEKEVLKKELDRVN